MTPEELSKKLSQLKRMGLSVRCLSELCGYKSHKSMVYIATGKLPVPNALAEYINKLLQWHLDNPPPQLPRAWHTNNHT